MRLMVTGGSGFIGSAVVRDAVGRGDHVANLDLMTYAATEGSTASVADSERYVHDRVDIRDAGAVAAAFARHSPDAVMHLAAESHVDRSIGRPSDFVTTNVVGTTTLLEAATRYWETLEADSADAFRFHHVSTDEVFGSLGGNGYFDLTSPYAPRSPYAASKASADHFVRAWATTYGLPVVVSNCSNNYGPFQYPEKLIPLMTIRGMQQLQLPIYGTGANVRDWLFVEDHVSALRAILAAGIVGETYLVGGGAERSNREVVEAICDRLDERMPKTAGSHRDDIAFVDDRPGHDFRYAIDARSTSDSLGWVPKIDFAAGLARTVDWYVDNEWWWGPIVERTASVERAGVGLEYGDGE